MKQPYNLEEYAKLLNSKPTWQSSIPKVFQLGGNILDVAVIIVRLVVESIIIAIGVGMAIDFIKNR